MQSQSHNFIFTDMHLCLTDYEGIWNRELQYINEEIAIY